MRGIPALDSRHYAVYGLVLHSELECPELPLAAEGEPDVVVRLGAVPAALPDPCAAGVLYQVQGERFLFRLPGTAAFLAEAGREITVDLTPDADPGAVRLLLYGSVLAAVLHQRGVLPLHGSAVATDRGAVVFVGASGAGKSTLAAAMAQRGYSVLADDVSAIDTSGDVPHVALAYPRLLLWPDAAEHLAVPEEQLQQVRKRVPKCGWRLGDGFASRPMPVYAVYALQPASATQLGMSALHGAQKLRVLAEHTYRRRYLLAMGRAAQHFAQTATVARQVRLSRVTRPRDAFALDELTGLIIADVQQ